MAASIPLFKVHMPDEAHAALARVLASGQLAGGIQVEQFERGLAQYVGNDRVCAMSDASGALTLSLSLAGVRPGDEVVVSPMVCLATAMPIANLFARPVWCDVDARTGMIMTDAVASLIGERTKAVVAYNWSGDVADLEGLAAAAHRRGVKIVVDASEALGAEYRGRKLGDSFADFTVLSFAAVRQVTTGEGAAVFFSDAGDFERGRRLRYYGIDARTFRLPGGDLNPASDVPVPGYCFRMNNIAAAIGLTQLRHLDAVVERHRENGHYFDRALRGTPGLTLLERRADSVSGYWTYALRAERRDDLVKKLHAEGIGAQRLHLRADRYSCFAASRRDAELPGVEGFDRENVSIPCGWWVSDQDRDRIVRCLRSGW